jgi:histone acetyltransferase (RNA polymerase elongator complex component)
MRKMGPERRLNAVSLLGASPPTKPVSLMSTIAVVAVMAKPWECERGTQKNTEKHGD